MENELVLRRDALVRNTRIALRCHLLSIRERTQLRQLRVLILILLHQLKEQSFKKKTQTLYFMGE